METPDLLSNRLNFDAIVFCGCTMKEMQSIAITCLSVCIVLLSLLTKLAFNMLLIGVGVSFPVGVGVTWSVAMVFQRFKQGRPKGFVKQRLLLWLEDKRIQTSPFVRRSGKWSIGKYFR